MRPIFGLLFMALLALAACSAPPADLSVSPTPTAVDRIEDDEEQAAALAESGEPSPNQTGPGPRAGGQGMGPGAMRGQGQGMAAMGGGHMHAMHTATIPQEYAGRMSPIPADEESLERGAVIYSQNCSACHGETGMGDGPAGAALDPAPPMIAMTSQMLGDDYMLWRVSEGGAFEPFNSAMPTWKAVLSEDQRWDVINYVRTLGGSRGMGPGSQGMGPNIGANANMEEMMRAEMLATGIEMGIITQEQADLFDAVHAQIDALRAADPDRQFTGTMADLQDELLSELVAGGEVTQADADAFSEIHALLEDAGIMQ